MSVPSGPRANTVRREPAITADGPTITGLSGGTGVLVGVGVLVGSTDVLVGVGVLVGGTDVLVGVGVLVGGTDVLVGVGVLVGGTRAFGVAVDGFAVGAAVGETGSIPMFLKINKPTTPRDISSTTAPMYTPMRGDAGTFLIVGTSCVDGASSSLG